MKDELLISKARKELKHYGVISVVHLYTTEAGSDIAILDTEFPVSDYRLAVYIKRKRDRTWHEIYTHSDTYQSAIDEFSKSFDIDLYAGESRAEIEKAQTQKELAASLLQKVNCSLLDLTDVCIRSFSNLSHDPEKRGTNEIKRLENFLRIDLLEILNKVGEGFEEAAIEAANRYVNGYRTRCQKVISARSRTASAFIVGPAKFPIARNEKAQAVELARSNELDEWRQSASNAIVKSISGETKPPSKNEGLHQEFSGDGFRIVANGGLDMVQIIYDSKPSPELISKLKKNAFKWSPTNKAWQRKLTRNAIDAASEITGKRLFVINK